MSDQEPTPEFSLPNPKDIPPSEEYIEKINAPPLPIVEKRNYHFQGRNVRFAQLRKIAESYGITKKTLVRRLEDGWEVETAATMPPGYKRYNRVTKSLSRKIADLQNLMLGDFYEYGLDKVLVALRNEYNDPEKALEAFKAHICPIIKQHGGVDLTENIATADIIKVMPPKEDDGLDK